MVLTQHELSRPSLRPCKLFPYHYGSYATESLLNAAYYDFMQFPYHYGSYATRKSQPISSTGKAFPYHYGSYATWTGEPPASPDSNQFPYHYGSYATETHAKGEPDDLPVSIPLWFLRNGG